MTSAQYKIVGQQMEAGITPAETYDFLINAYLDMKVVQRDIYNAREKIKHQKLKGRTRIAALLHELEDAKDGKGEEKWNTARRRNPITKEITGLLFSLVDSLHLWQRYPIVLHIDATYKVNRYNVPLLSVVGTTGLNTTFYIANIFLVGKEKEDYVWAITQLRRLGLTIHQIPKVIFIDKEDALAAAIKEVFPKSRQFYCIWHINKCILAKLRKVYPNKTHQVEQE